MSFAMLKFAIETRQPLTGVYDNYVRFFCPHILGKDATGEPSVVSFQYGGGRPNGLLPPGGAWYLFLVGRLHSLEVNSDKWEAGPQDTKPWHLISVIDLQSAA